MLRRKKYTSCVAHYSVHDDIKMYMNRTKDTALDNSKLNVYCDFVHETILKSSVVS